MAKYDKKFVVTSKITIRKRINQFVAFGYEGVERKKNWQASPMNFKIDIVNYFYQSGLGGLELSFRFNLPSA